MMRASWLQVQFLNLKAFIGCLKAVASKAQLGKNACKGLLVTVAPVIDFEMCHECQADMYWLPG